MPLTRPTRRIPPLRRLTAICALAFAALCAAAGPAQAHADLVSTSPADGSVVATEPTQVTLTFSEDVTVSLSSVRVIGPDGHPADTGGWRARPPGSEGPTLVVNLTPGAPHGTFVVVWHATAADDGHTTSGSYTFSVGTRSLASATIGGPNRWTDGVLDVAIGAGFIGFALLAGFAAVHMYCLPRTPPDEDPDPAIAALAAIRWPAALGYTTLLAGTLLQLFTYGLAAREQSLAHLFDRSVLSATLSTREGHALLARIVLLALIAAVGETLLRHPRGRLPAVVLTLAFAATWSTASHAAAGMQMPLALAVTTVHVSAMAVWVGGLFSMCVLLARRGGADLGSTVTRFSRMALMAVAALAITGLYQAWREVGYLSALTDTTYGRLLIVKTGGLVLVLVVASRSRARVARWRGTESGPGLRRSILVELVGVVALLVVTVLLIGNAPARDAKAHSVAMTTSKA